MTSLFKKIFFKRFFHFVLIFKERLISYLVKLTNDADFDKNKNSIMEIRPFSTQNFDQKLQNFQNYIDEVTFKDSEFSTDERRTKILGIL